MARSQYIYGVWHSNGLDPESALVGLFTVKWEAVRAARWSTLHRKALEIRRYKDGGATLGLAAYDVVDLERELSALR